MIKETKFNKHKERQMGILLYRIANQHVICKKSIANFNSRHKEKR